MTPQDEYDAKTRRYSNDVIILLQLHSGNVAVYNNARMLTGIINKDENLHQAQLTAACEQIQQHFWRKPVSTIHSENADEPTQKPPLNLDKFL